MSWVNTLSPAAPLVRQGEAFSKAKRKREEMNGWAMFTWHSGESFHLRKAAIKIMDIDDGVK